MLNHKLSSSFVAILKKRSHDSTSFIDFVHDAKLIELGNDYSFKLTVLSGLRLDSIKADLFDCPFFLRRKVPRILYQIFFIPELKPSLLSSSLLTGGVSTIFYCFISSYAADTKLSSSLV